MHEVRSATLYPSQRIYAVLDLLLTCETAAEARDKTKFAPGGCR